MNAHGIEWVVQKHATIPTADTLQRWRSGEIQPADDLYPVVAPKSLSPELSEFICAIGRCTTKTFAFVDTMPGRRKDGHMPWAAHIDTLVHPETNLLFLDIARVNETVMAHEFGHAWVQYVDECEDLRTLEDAGNPQRTKQVSFVQSFVLDLKVNDLIARRGFDMSPIRNDQEASLFQLAELLRGGYQPEYPAEEVFMALTVADALIQREREEGSELAWFDDSLATIEGTLAPMVGLAERMAESVRKHGYDSHAPITACIDECLLASFEHCGDQIDLDAELVLLNPEEPDRDKFPEWLPILTPRAKCTVGKHMARNDISSDWTQRIAPSITGMAKLTFVSPAADRRSDIPLGVMIGKPTRYSHLPEMAAELLAMKIRNRTGDLQLDGGPPHSLENCLHTPPQPRPDHRPQGQVPDPRFPWPTLPPEFQQGPNWPGRPYMAGTARFLTAVRLEQQLAGEHPFAYALNNPVTYTDPTGDAPQKGGLRVRRHPGTGACKVVVCSQYTTLGHFFSHTWICSFRANGDFCASSAYPSGQHAVSSLGGCKTDAKQRIWCDTISTNCSDAIYACWCIKAHSKDNWWTHGGCIGNSNRIQDCIDNKGQDRAQIPIAIA